MGRKTDYSVKVKRGPGKKTRKQPEPKFPKKLLEKGKKVFFAFSTFFIKF